MTFRQKIDKILSSNKLGVSSISALEDHCLVGRGAIKKLYTGETLKGLKTEKKIIDKLRINQTWWDTGEEPIFRESSQNYNPEAPDDLEDDKSPEAIYRDLVESNSDYRLVPKTILDGEYRVVPVSAINTQDRLLDQLQKENERLWRLLEEYKARS